MVGMLAAGVSHEFKNYLGGIIGNASYTLEELGGDRGLEQARETLETIIDIGEKANQVAMSLLSYSRTSCLSLAARLLRLSRISVELTSRFNAQGSSCRRDATRHIRL